ELELTKDMVNALLEAGDAVGAQLARHRGDTTEAVDASAIVARLQALTQKEQAKPAEDPGFGFFDEPDPKWGRRSTDHPEVEVAPAGRRTTDKTVVSAN